MFGNIVHAQGGIPIDGETKRVEREKLSLQRKAAAFGLRLEPPA
jgi:hypothetical protein